MFNEFPYTNYEKINLDWLLDLGKKLKEDAESGAFDGERGKGIFGITTIYAEAGAYYCYKIGNAGVGDFVIGYGSAAGTNTLYLMKVTSVTGNYLNGTSLLQITGPQGPQGQQGEPGEGGLTEAMKQAFLQLARKVAYIDNNGQTYYNALYTAFYGGAPVVVLDSISAAFNQGSSVIYDTDSLNVLKQYLVVTATYSDSSTATVPSADYTLSGTLAVGTSTITVSYSGKTTTFNVTVTHYERVLLHSWYLTNSLDDTVGDVTAVIGSGASMDSRGVHLTAAKTAQQISFNGVLEVDTTIEIDVATADFLNTSKNGRFIMFDTNNGIIYRSTGVWQSYMGSWSASSVNVTNANVFNGDTAVLKINSQGIPTLYNSLGNVIVDNIASVSNYSNFQIGASDFAFYNLTITAVRIYRGVE